MRAALLLGLSLLIKQAAELVSQLEQWAQGRMRLDQIFAALLQRDIEALGRCHTRFKPPRSLVNERNPTAALICDHSGRTEVGVRLFKHCCYLLQRFETAEPIQGSKIRWEGQPINFPNRLRTFDEGQQLIHSCLDLIIRNRHENGNACASALFGYLGDRWLLR